jgi:hypothetical protein
LNFLVISFVTHFEKFPAMHNLYIKAVVFSLSILLGACVTQSLSTQGTELPSFLTVDSKLNYGDSDIATFKIENNSDQKKIYIYHPEEVEIERKTKDGWKQVDILYCPCGASCPPPPEQRVIAPGGTVTKSWNLKSQWCEGTNLHGQIPETKTQYAGKGSYRFVFRYRLKENSEIKTYFENFKLKEQ